MRKLPSLRRHKPTSQAVVTLSGKDFYLGVWPANRRTPPTIIHEKYERLITEWLAAGRQLSSGEKVLALSAAAADLPSVAEVLAMYWTHAERYYRRRNGTPSPELGCLRAALRHLRMYDDLPVSEFSPKKLKAVREAMIRDGLMRTTINYHVGRIKRVFAWAAENEFIAPAVYHGLQSVRGLKAGRSEAREPHPVRPVPRQLVEKTLPHLPPTVAAMAQLQMLTAMRSAEICRLRPTDLDQTVDVWVYRVGDHKTAYHGKERVVPIGPQAQAVLAPLLAAVGPDDFVFSPARTQADRQAMRSSRRKTPRWRSHMERNRRKRKADPKRRAGDRYTPTAYGRCVARACQVAFPLPVELARGMVAEATGRLKPEREAQWRERLGDEGWAKVEQWRKDHHWHPHQLRHLRGTEVRQRFGLDAAQVVLGHCEASVTEIYARADLAKAAEVARLTG
jgi:integrase